MFDIGPRGWLPAKENRAKSLKAFIERRRPRKRKSKMMKTISKQQNKWSLAAILLLLVLLAAGVSGCGGNAAETPEKTSPGTAVTASGAGVTTNGAADIQAKSTVPAADKAVTSTGISACGTAAKGMTAKSSASGKHICTFSINCSTILDNMDKLDPAKADIVPKGGIIYAAAKITFKPGESVFDLLQRITKDNKIHMEFTETPGLNTNYVEGIANLYEFDCGELSGWTYRVNGKVVGYGSSNAIIKDGDVIEWLYTCDQGRDVGGPALD